MLDYCDMCDCLRTLELYRPTGDWVCLDCYDDLVEEAAECDYE